MMPLTSPDSKSHTAMKWGAAILIITLILVGSYVALPIIPILPAIIAVASASESGAMTPLLSLFVVSLPLFFLIGLIFLFKKQKYILIIILCLIAFGAIGTYLRNYLRAKVESSISKVGISVKDAAPPGILNLPDTAIPKAYYLGLKGQVVKYDFSPIEYYYKEYYADVRTGGDKDIIRFGYQEKECLDFYLVPSEYIKKATCKAGPCALVTNYPLPEFQINDNGTCATVAFTALKDNSITHEEAQHIVDSLVRVPGERPQRTFEEVTKSTIEIVHRRLERLKKISKSGLYQKLSLSVPLTYTVNHCVSTLQVDIAPDQKSFVIHRPVCPDNEMSYCIENGQTEITTASTTLIKQTYHCK